MRRSGISWAVVLLLVLSSASTAVAQSASPGSPSPESQSPGPATSPPAGGNLTIDVPAGAAPAGTTVTVVARTPDERPDELKTVPSALAFYEVQPADVAFSAPATVTRTVGFGELGIDQYDPFVNGLVVGSLFTRAADGSWSWLQDAAVSLDAAGGGFTITATTDHAGPILTDIVGSLIVANEDATSTPVGQTFRVEGQVRVDAASRADVAAITATTSDESIVKAGDSYDVTFFDRAEGIELHCLAPGTVQYETTFTVSDVGDVGALSTAVALPGTEVSITQTGEHTCG